MGCFGGVSDAAKRCRLGCSRAGGAPASAWHPRIADSPGGMPPVTTSVHTVLPCPTPPQFPAVIPHTRPRFLMPSVPAALPRFERTQRRKDRWRFCAFRLCWYTVIIGTRESSAKRCASCCASFDLAMSAESCIHMQHHMQRAELEGAVLFALKRPFRPCSAQATHDRLDSTM